MVREFTERRLTTPVRKVAVIVLYGAYGSGALLWTISGGLKSLPVAVLVSLLMLSVFGALGVLFKGTRYWAWGNAPDDRLDEFQVTTRNAAYKAAYVVLASSALIGLLAGRILSDMGVWRPEDLQLDLLFWGWFLLSLTLPAAILAWTEKPLDDD